MEPIQWGGIMGRSLPYSKAMIHEVYEEMNLSLLSESNTYSDVPFWVDVPAEKEVEEPKGMRHNSIQVTR
jgi:hypothetical protein